MDDVRDPSGNQPSADGQTTAASPEAGSSRLSVLLVASSEDRGHLVGELVEAVGHRLVVCGDPGRALGTALIEAPHMVIVDCGIGLQSAATVLSGIGRPFVGRRPYILVIAPPSQHDVLAGWRFDDVMSSPPSRDEIAFRIQVAEQRIRHDPGFRDPWSPGAMDHRASAPYSLEPVDGWWEWDCETGLVRYSERWGAMVGLEVSDLEPNLETWRRLVHPDDLTQLVERLDAFLEGRVQDLEHGHRLQFADGAYRWVLTRCFAFRGEGGGARRVIGMHTDVTAQMRTEEQLQYVALHDPLTGLPNRTLFIDRLRQAFLRVQRDRDDAFALLFLDVDRFKNVNDAFGHLTGDRLLRAIAARLESALRPSDTVARFGGDEFVILAEGIQDARSAMVIAERVREEFRHPFNLKGTEVFVSVSMGVAEWSDRYAMPEDILRDADTAMYRAKTRGKNRVDLFDENMHREVVAALRLESDLRRAVDREEFEVFYQPIVTLETGRISGFEALVRWRHPERGLLPPADFIPLAEEIGLIIQIDRWVLEEACRQLRNWQVRFRQNPPLKVNVNLSGMQFARPDLITQVDHVVRKAGLFGRSLNLEITESLIMEDASHAAAMLKQLKALEIGICIDDFGTGYSSLSYLKKFDIDTLKIDHSFVSRVLYDEESLEIVRTITSLAHNLGKVTVVEGVETAGQLSVVRSMNPACIQGFYVAPPVPAGDAELLLETAFRRDNHLEAVIEATHGTSNGDA